MLTNMLAIVMLAVCVIQLEGASVTYKIGVQTGDFCSSAGTNANVYIIIYGEQGDTGEIMLTSSTTNTDPFERNNLDKFSEEGDDVGKITKIKIGHDNNGFGASWQLKEVVINIGDTTCEYTFPVSGWVSKGNLHKFVFPEAGGKNCDEGATVTYKIDVKTGGTRYAATDANVYIIIYGEKAETAKIMLTSSATNPFEKSNLDRFNVEGIDVGKITKIRIGHDNSGDGPGWYLDDVVIKIGDKSCEFNFIADGWLQDDDLHKDLYTEADGRKCEGATVTYKIDVKTGDVRYAGTDAKVYIIIYGEKGDTGMIILRKSATNDDMFEQSNLDKFTEEAVDVGTIKDIRIGHDDTGSGSGWYLDEVAIAVGDTSYKFIADEWLEDDALDIDLSPAKV